LEARAYQEQPDDYRHLADGVEIEVQRQADRGSHQPTECRTHDAAQVEYRRVQRNGVQHGVFVDQLRFECLSGGCVKGVDRAQRRREDKNMPVPDLPGTNQRAERDGKETRDDLCGHQEVSLRHVVRDHAANEREQ
jgi:hypothetical protein